MNRSTTRRPLIPFYECLSVLSVHLSVFISAHRAEPDAMRPAAPNKPHRRMNFQLSAPFGNADHSQKRESIMAHAQREFAEFVIGRIFNLVMRAKQDGRSEPDR